MHISRFWCWTMGILLVLMMIGVPSIHYRQVYRYGKRLREVAEGKLYRSGCLTVEGLRDAIQKYKIKTVINLQEEAPDPKLPNHYFTFQTTPESEVCRNAGATMVFLEVQTIDARQMKTKKSPTIDAFLEIMDNPAKLPALLHCRAGLHRTGCLVAVYREEYENWSKEDALRELKNNGFGEFFSTSANPYVAQFVLGYQPRKAAATANQVQAKTVGRTGDGHSPFHPLPSGPNPTILPPAP